MTPQVVAPPLLTLAEFLGAHGHESHVDLVRGRLVRFPMPGSEHGRICGKVSRILGNFADDHDLGHVLTNDTFIRLSAEPPTVRGADIAFISYARLPRGPLGSGPLEVMPELVVEVRSPSDRRGTSLAKIADYLVAGVPVVMVVDPALEAVALYRGDELPQRLHNGDELTLPDILPGFSVPVKRFFE